MCFNMYSGDWIFIAKTYLQDYLRDHKASDEYDCNSLAIILERWINKHTYKNHYPYLLWFALRELLFKKFEDVPKFNDVVDTVLMNRHTFMNVWSDYDAVVEQAGRIATSLHDSSHAGHELTAADVKEMIICNKYNFHEAIYNVINVAKELLDIHKNLKDDVQINFDDDFPLNISGDIFGRGIYNDCAKSFENRNYYQTSDQLKHLRMYLQKCIKEDDVCDTDVNEYRIELSDYIRAYLLNIHSNNFPALCYSMWYTARILFMNAEKGIVYMHDITNLNTAVKIYHIDLSKCIDCNIEGVNYKKYADYCDCTDAYNHIYHNIMFIQQRLCDDVYKFGKDSILEYLGNIVYVPLELD